MAPPALFRVMTWNVSNGVDDKIVALLSSNADQRPAKVEEVYRAYFARSFHARAAAIARIVKLTEPELIGLQEAMLVQTKTQGDGLIDALDYVAILLSALNAEEPKYSKAVDLTTFEATLPSTLGFAVRHADREVILRRNDVNIARPGGQKFTNYQSIPLPNGPTIGFFRGWVQVDVTIQNRTVRLISTHLDRSTTTSGMQAGELVAATGPAAPGTTPVAIVGDFNSTDSQAAYMAVKNKGFKDAAQGAVGNTPTYGPKIDPLRAESEFNQRYDFILFRGDGLNARETKVVGNMPADRTGARFWPSDHAGVVTEFQLQV